MIIDLILERKHREEQIKEGAIEAADYYLKKLEL